MNKHTFVLVHGAWFGAWVWRDVASGLSEMGHAVTTPTLTGIGERRHLGDGSTNLSTHIEDVALHVEMEDLQDITLVGWSYGGLVSAGVLPRANRRPQFPNAQIYISEIDFNFWTDARLLGSPLDAFVALARKNLLPVRDRIVFINDGQEFLPGVQAMLTPGHTRGHIGFLLTSGNQSLYLIGDLSHHHVLLLERPRISFAYDLDPTKAADSRVKVLDMVSTDRTAIFGYHFPWPGIGHVAREHGGFRYFPKPTRWIT